MKKLQILIMVLAGLGSFSLLSAQINVGGTPYSFNHALSSPKNYSVKMMPSIEKKQIALEDIEDEKNGIPPRFGIPFKVKYNLSNSGHWTTLDNGDQIWRLTIAAPDAKSINLMYSDFWLPDGALLYIYNEDHSSVIGGFTSRNNKGKRDTLTPYSTGLVLGDQITLEYYEPEAVIGHGQISIETVVHGYRLTNPFKKELDKLFRDSGSCQVNINCSEGTDYQVEKRAVAMIMIGGSRWCTGALLNAHATEFVPYFLTANHCFDESAFPLNPLDAIDNPNAPNWVFYFNYESSNCGDPISDPIRDANSFSGAYLVANNSDSDFGLFRILEDPKSSAPAYLGWTTNTPGRGGVGIHHPSGDVQKISTHNMTPSSRGDFWELYWSSTRNGYGVTERGSSGSPLLDQNGRVVGQLFGGSYANCDDPANDLARYGKLSVSWDNSPFRSRRLKDWLGSECTSIRNIRRDFEGEEPVYRASIINATNVVDDDAFVRYEGTSYVDLEPGFDARAGSNFRASIGIGCRYGSRRNENGKDGSFTNTVNSEGVEIIPSAEESKTVENRSVVAKNTLTTDALQIAPNPFVGSTNLTLNLTTSQSVSIQLRNTYGQLIREVMTSQSLSSGTHKIELDATNLASGLYHVVVQTETETITQSVVLAKS